MFISITLLLHAMIVHGYAADDLLFAVLVSFPKDTRASMCISDNYILNMYSNLICSSDLQFASKKGHSLVLCTTVLKETVQYFLMVTLMFMLVC